MQQELRIRILEARQEAMVEGLEAAMELIEKALPKFNWGASALDADAIALLNEVPQKVRHALRAAAGNFDLPERKIFEPKDLIPKHSSSNGCHCCVGPEDPEGYSYCIEHECYKPNGVDYCAGFQPKPKRNRK
jgi:hypothetical protein